MATVPRLLEPALRRAARQFPALVLTGPRRSGKTTVLQRVFPHASNVLLEDPDILARVRADPRGFLDELRLPVILDEIQHAPELFAYVRTRIDAAPRSKGRWLLTGSQEAPLMRGVTESMAGRAAVFQLLPFSTRESPKVTAWLGGFPEAVLKPSGSALWFRSYVQTYLERDVRAVSALRDLATFRRFLALLASRSGQLLNKTDLAAPLGISVPTVTQWLSILEITALILIVPPYFENFGKRLSKSPKVYLGDSGLLHFLLGLRTETDLEGHPKVGASFEGFAIQQVVRALAAEAEECFVWGVHTGAELDLLVVRGRERLGFEVKHTSSPRLTPSMRSAMEALQLRRLDVVVPGAEVYPLADDVRVVGIETLPDAVRTRV